MKRVYVLVIASMLALTAGCLDPEAVVTVQELNGTESVTESASIKLEDVNPSVRQAVLEGESNETAREVESSRLVEHNDSYFEISREATGEGEAVIADINVSKTKDEANYSSEDLLDKDLVPVANFERYEGDSSPRAVLNQRYVTDEIQKSVLLEERDIVVRYNGANYRLEVNNTVEQTEDLYVYESVTRFNSSEEYYESIQEKYVFTLSDIPNGSEEIWLEAVNNGGYYGEETDGFNNLKERFEDETAFERTDSSGVWYTEYDGTVHRVKIDST